MTDDDAARLRALATASLSTVKGRFDLAMEGDAILALLDALDEARAERDAVLADWNALVKAIGSKTNGGAVGHAGRVVRERDDALALLRECRGWLDDCDNPVELLARIDALLGGGGEGA